MSRVLIAAHVPEHVEHLSRIIVAGGHDIASTVYTGRDAIEQAERLRPDVAVIESFLPIVSGADAALRIRAAGIRVVVLTLGEKVADGLPVVAMPLTADELLAAISGSG